MVWSKLILFIFFFINTLNAAELTQEEKNYFKFLDLNNDGFLTIEEINQSTKIIFQLIDENRDGILNEQEIIELKNILESLS